VKGARSFVASLLRINFQALARCFWQELAPAISEGELDQVVLHETERNSVRYRGEDE